MPRDGILVEEISQVGYVALCGFPIYAPRTFISSGFQGTLGFGFPTALGVKIANPGKTVVSINGDGGFLYGLAELSAAAQQNIGVVAVVFNNHSYQNVRRDQLRLFQGPRDGRRPRYAGFRGAGRDLRRARKPRRHSPAA